MSCGVGTYSLAPDELNNLGMAHSPLPVLSSSPFCTFILFKFLSLFPSLSLSLSFSHCGQAGRPEGEGKLDPPPGVFFSLTFFSCWFFFIPKTVNRKVKRENGFGLAVLNEVCQRRVRCLESFFLP